MRVLLDSISGAIQRQLSREVETKWAVLNSTIGLLFCAPTIISSSSSYVNTENDENESAIPHLMFGNEGL